MDIKSIQNNFSHLTFASQSYQVKEGDNLQSIASQFGVTPEALAQANGLPYDAQLTAETDLIIPREQLAGKVSNGQGLLYIPDAIENFSASNLFDPQGAISPGHPEVMELPKATFSPFNSLALAPLIRNHFTGGPEATSFHYGSNSVRYDASENEPAQAEGPEPVDTNAGTGINSTTSKEIEAVLNDKNLTVEDKVMLLLTLILLQLDKQSSDPNAIPTVQQILNDPILRLAAGTLMIDYNHFGAVSPGVVDPAEQQEATPVSNSSGIPKQGSVIVDPDVDQLKLGMFGDLRPSGVSDEVNSGGLNPEDGSGLGGLIEGTAGALADAFLKGFSIGSSPILSAGAGVRPGDPNKP